MLLHNDVGYRSVLVGLQHEASDDARLGFTERLGRGRNRAPDVAADAAAWLDERPADDDPFLLVCGMFEVHRDWPSDRYPPTHPSEVTVPGYLPDNDHTREDLASFHGAIRVAGHGLGVILEAVRRNGLDEDTIVVFTTDHGAPFPRAKSTLYDPGVHVTLMVRVPTWIGSAAPRREPGLVSHVDVVPTLLELAGVRVPEDVQGVSLAETLRDGASPVREEVFLEKTYHADYDPMRAVRTPSHKYIRSFEPRPMLALPPDLEASATRRGMDDAHLHRVRRRSSTTSWPTRARRPISWPIPARRSSCDSCAAACGTSCSRRTTPCSTARFRSRSRTLPPTGALSPR